MSAQRPKSNPLQIRDTLFAILLGAISISSTLAQSDLELADPSINLGERTREPRVLAPTLAPEELDRAVLNRLMQEIAHSREVTAERLSFNEEEIENTYISLSNARSFINNNESANLRAMCLAWNRSSNSGDVRIKEALDAYKRRRQFTLEFIETYYKVVRAEIESGLDEISKLQFQRYMEDRRMRMANSGATSFGPVVENISSGRETVESHCRR